MLAEGQEACHKLSMNNLGLLGGLLALLCAVTVSCESTNSRRAGGGAFDDSALGRKLDANSHLDDPRSPEVKSHSDWLEKE